MYPCLCSNLALRATMAPKRTRFGLDGDGVRQLAAVLSPYVDKAGWIRYGEDMKKGQVCAKTILSKKKF